MTQKDLINKYNHKMKKKFGQNFIHDENIINKIINLSELNKDITVIEIGPGSGVLTKKLALISKKVIAYEIDKTLQKVLDDELKNYSNVEIIYEDFLKTDINIDNKNIYVVANLPYYITTPIIMKLINSNIDIEKIIIMVQKEVGERFSSKPGTKDCSSITVFLNYYYNIKKLMDVSRNAFIPIPNVDSVVLELSKKEEQLKVDNEEKFFMLVRDAFQFKRKTLRNNLKNYDLKILEEILNKYNLDLSIRAEKVPLEIFVDIANKIK